MCNTQPDAITPKTVFDSIEHIKHVYPYSVEVLVFPYEHPDVNYDIIDDEYFDCTEFETLVKNMNNQNKKKRS